MKRFLILFLALILVFTGCTEPDLTGEGRVLLSINSTVRGFSPISMDVKSYDINIVNSGKNYDKTVNVLVAEVGNIALTVPSGTVDIHVIAKNAEDTAIGGGDELGFNVLPAKDNAVSVTVAEYEGNGQLDVSVTSDIVFETLTAKISNANGNNTLELAKDVQSGAFKGSINLKNGFYEVRFFSGEEEVSVFQTVRIVKDKTTELVLTKDAFTVGKISLTVDKSSMPSDVASYSIKLVGDNGFNVTESLDGNTCIQVVPAGTLNVTVTALDCNSRKIGENSKSITVAPSTTVEESISVEEFTGNGTLSFSVETKADFKSLVAEVHKKGTQEVFKTVNLSKTATNEFTSSIDVPQGFYNVVYKENGVKVAGTDNVRVLQDSTSNLNANVTDSWNFKVTITDTIKPTPKVQLTLKEQKEYRVGESFTVSAKLEDILNPTNEWYFNNKLISGQNGIELTYAIPEGTLPGKHTVTFKTSDGSGAVWSENIAVTVAAAKQVYVPEFSDAYNQMVPTARGIHSIQRPEGPFTTDPAMAPAVMISMPLMTSLKAIEDKDIQIDFTRPPVAYYAYGILVRPQINVDGTDKSGCSINEDGVFMRYDVIEVVDDQEKIVGTIDYYYSWVTETFSYRQYFVNTLDMMVGPGQTRNHNSIMVLELLDVPVKHNSKNFSVGLIDPSTGKLKENCHIDILYLGDTLNRVPVGDPVEWKYAEGYFRFKRAWMVMNSIDGVMRSMCPTFADMGNPWQKWSENAEYKALIEKYTARKTATSIDPGSDPSIDLKYVINGSNRDVFDMEFVYDWLIRTYVNGSSVAKTDVRNPEFCGVYTTKVDFDNDNLIAMKSSSPCADNLTVDAATNSPTIFDLNKKEGASLLKIGDSLTDSVGKEGIPESCSYNRYYTFTKDENHRPTTSYIGIQIPEYVDQLNTQHLKALGIVDENFIANYIYFDHWKNELNSKAYPLPDEIIPDNRDPKLYKEVLDNHIMK